MAGRLTRILAALLLVGIAVVLLEGHDAVLCQQGRGLLQLGDRVGLQIEKLLDTDISGIVHTTSDGYSSWYDAACYFLEKMGVAHSFVPCTTEQYPTPAHRPANSILRNKVLDDRGISLFRSWQEDVDRFTEEHGEHLLAEARAALAGS